MYLCLNELFEIELYICIKMDLALNNLQKLMRHKIQTVNQQTNKPKLLKKSDSTSFIFDNHIYQPLRSGTIWHKVNF